MPLQLLDMVWPKARAWAAWPAAGSIIAGPVQPSGRADLRVRGLSRAGLVLASKPIDVGLAAVLDGGKAAMRAVAVSDGKTIGRAQARFAPLGAGPIVAALVNAPMLLQLRYAGPADTLWRLSGVEIVRPVAGRSRSAPTLAGGWSIPQIRGSLKAAGRADRKRGDRHGGRPDSGPAAASRVAAGARSRSAGRRRAAERSPAPARSISPAATPALDLKFDASKARLLDRDDIAADGHRADLAIRSSGRGGHDQRQSAARQRAASRSAGRAPRRAVPQLAGPRMSAATRDEVIEIAQLQPWTLDVKVAGGDLTVRGLGIDSRWTTDLDDRRHGRCAAIYRARRPDPRRL